MRLALISKCTQDDDSARVVPSAFLLWKRNAPILPLGEPYVTQPCPQVSPLSQKGLECTNPPLPAQPPHPRCHLNLNKVPLGSKSALSGGFFLPRAHIYYPFIIDEWPPGRQRRLSYRPGTFTILAHWPVSFFFFFFPFPSLSYWLLLNSFPVECFSSLNFLHHCWISNLPIIDLLLEFRPRSTATYFTPTFPLWSLHLKGQWTAEQLSLFLVDLFGVLH